MLVSLNVKNFAIIDNIEMDFSSGMTVLTGETGAGKSLIIDAISLLLGKRAQVEQVRHGEVKASITGVFSSMDWNLVEERDDMVRFMADLIKVRKTISIPRISDIEDIKSIFDFFYLPNNALTLTIRDERYLYGHKKILFVINPTEKLLPIEFDEYFKIYFLSTGLIKDKKDILIKNYLATPFSLLIFTLD